MITVRVATSNNFNCTEAEWAQLDTFAQSNSDKYFFINANIKTPALLSINDHPYKVVITLNPDLNPEPGLEQRLNKLDPAKVAFVRIKWLPERDDIQGLIQRTARKHKVVLTVQRFNGKKTLSLYTTFENYEWDHSKYRLHGKALKDLYAFAKTNKVFICDKKGLGCQGCGLCSSLTVGKVYPIKALNLSTSGVCPHSCVDCYAKTMQHFAVACGHRPMDYDRIFANDKQAGKLKHIQERKAA